MNEFPITLHVEWIMTDISFLEENTDFIKRRELLLSQMKDSGLTDGIAFILFRDFVVHKSKRYFKTKDSAEQLIKFLNDVCAEHGKKPPKTFIENNA
jgi:hypothetical protein